jgi:NAD(P)-dependent dehydrogenase (short-subunit alcohol dehydrogenase family)
LVNSARILGLTARYPEGTPTLAYTTSDGAPANPTRTLANEWALLGIDVNAIAPGYFRDQDDAPRPGGGGGADGADETRWRARRLKEVRALFASDACAFITS